MKTGVVACLLVALLASCDVGALTAPEDMEASERPATATTMRFSSSFTEFAPLECVRDGDAAGPWQVRFTGFGCVRLGTDGSITWLEMAPRTVESPAQTSASLVLGPSLDGPLHFSVRLATDEQLRAGSLPNAWEVGWIVWHYTDDDHFYYLIPKPNGWELGKRDPAYPGGQRFLASGSSPVHRLGIWHEAQIHQVGNAISVWVNGVHLTTFKDTERPYSSGHIGLYSEDAAVRFADVRVS